VVVHRNLPFDEYFDLSLFTTKSESELEDTVLDLEFTSKLEIQRANLSIDQYLLNSPQSSLTTDRIPELFEIASTSISSPSFPHTSEVHSSSLFITSLPQQPITTHQIPTTPVTTNPPVVPNPLVTTTPILNLVQLKDMALIYASLVMPAPQGVLPGDYQSKIVLFDGTRSYTVQ